MIISYNGDDYTIPDNVGDISLQEFVGWSAHAGISIFHKIANAASLSGVQADLTERLIDNSRMIQAVSYFSGIPFEDVANNIPLSEVAQYYRLSAVYKIVEIEPVTEEATYNFNSEVWELYTPSTSVSDPITQSEFASTLKLAEYFQEIENGDWSNAPIVCAAFFRKQAENFSSELLNPLGERVALLQSLPLNMAFATMQHNKDRWQDYVDNINNHWANEYPAL